ncbi:MAG: transporter [Peptococcaceae bacterium BICA1-8]|nr:MAG: transporter [Peptococcaceae bacterium BICA1-8]
MLIYWQIFLAFFIPAIVGYGGGPAFIPLIRNEVVNTYGWVTLEKFAELLAIANSLPGPIATKIAGYVAFQVGGVIGVIVALFALIAPSLLAMLFLLGLLNKFKDSPRVKVMTGLIRPTIAILLGVLAYEFFFKSWVSIGSVHTIIIIVLSFLFLERWKMHPVYVIIGSLFYGAFIIA